MQVIVVGAGVVGTALAQQLSSEGHRVSVIDSDRGRIRALQEKLDVLAVCGNAGHVSVLEGVGIRDADMCIAVTNVDEVNFVVGMIASRLGVTHSIVRIRNPEYADEQGVLAPKELGITRIINPEPAIVDSLLRMISIPGCTDVADLADGQIYMLGFDIGADSPMVGKALSELGTLSDLNAFLVLYVTRGDEVIVPRGSDVVCAGDNLHLLVSSDLMPFVLPLIHRHPPQVKQVLIAGAGRVALQVAEALEKRGVRVFLVDSDKELVAEAAERLKKSTVLLGEATDLDILEEASIDKCDLFCAVGDDDQRNMMAALLAKKHGAQKTAVIVHQPEYVPVLNSLGVEIVINPRLVTVGEILAHVRRGHIHTVRRVAESAAEIIEMDASPGSPVVAGPLKSIKFPRNALVGAIIREGVMMIPTGDTHIRPGETVVVFALPDAIERIEKLFSAGK